jgi:hypothetical protein
VTSRRLAVALTCVALVAAAFLAGRATRAERVQVISDPVSLPAVELREPPAIRDAGGTLAIVDLARTKPALRPTRPASPTLSTPPESPTPTPQAGATPPVSEPATPSPSTPAPSEPTKPAPSKPSPSPGSGGSDDGGGGGGG